jgi:hypothetical protein
VPTVALATVSGTALGAIELAEDEARDGAVIRHEGRELRVVGRLEAGDSEREFVILWVERAD